MNIDQRIDELTQQAANADIMGDFLACRLVRSSEPADAELPVPDADEIESNSMVATTVRFSSGQKPPTV